MTIISSILGYLYFKSINEKAIAINDLNLLKNENNLIKLENEELKNENNHLNKKINDLSNENKDLLIKSATYETLAVYVISHIEQTNFGIPNLICIFILSQQLFIL